MAGSDQYGPWHGPKEFLAFSPMNRRSNDVTAQSAAILSWLRQRESEMAALLADLVAIPTENPPGKNYRACVDFLESQLRQVGLDCERLGPGASRDDAANSPESLLASYGSGERALYFHGHYDVVQAQTSAQFQPQRKDHFSFGRGSADMKGGIVAMLYAIRALKEIAVDLKGRIGLALVPNEETGGTDGSAWLAQQGLLGRDGIGMLLAEPTSGVVWNANRGAFPCACACLASLRIVDPPAVRGVCPRDPTSSSR